MNVDKLARLMASRWLFDQLVTHVGSSDRRLSNYVCYFTIMLLLIFCDLQLHDDAAIQLSRSVGHA